MHAITQANDDRTLSPMSLHWCKLLTEETVETDSFCIQQLQGHFEATTVKSTLEDATIHNIKSLCKRIQRMFKFFFF